MASNLIWFVCEIIFETHDEPYDAQKYRETNGLSRYNQRRNGHFKTMMNIKDFIDYQIISNQFRIICISIYTITRYRAYTQLTFCGATDCNICQLFVTFVVHCIICMLYLLSDVAE